MKSIPASHHFMHICYVINLCQKTPEKSKETPCGSKGKSQRRRQEASRDFKTVPAEPTENERGDKRNTQEPQKAPKAAQRDTQEPTKGTPKARQKGQKTKTTISLHRQRNYQGFLQHIPAV